MARSARPGSTWALKLEGGLLSLQKKLERQDRSCPTRGLILHACSSLLQDRKDGKPAAIEIHRIGSNLFLKGHSSPLLSLRRWTRTGNPHELSDHDSLKGNSNIQIGWPDLPPNAETPAFLELLCSWLRDCERNHQQCRVGNIPQLPSGQFLPTRLLDVGQSRTRVWLRETKHMTPDELKGDTRYLALSHPWGDAKQHNHFCTTHANIGSRLLGGTLVQDFPNTLKDAIRVTQALNIRYLWVDTLCIIQGNDGDFETEAKRMEMVYSMAFVVIAASRATGTSDGFLSPRPSRKYVVLSGQPSSEDSGNRKRQEERRDNGVTYLCEAIDDFQKDVIDGPLNKRGWVLQERVLARRTIYFTRTQTYFECGAGVRCETLARMTNDQAAFLGDPNFPAVAMKSTKGAKIRLCQSLYETYSALEFTKAQDRSIAIAGLEQRLVRAYNTDGAYGVLDGGPSFFGRTLLWMRNGRVQDAMRPIDFDFSEGGEENASSMYYVVPSWSWMAYEGVITFMDLPFSGVEWRYVDEGLVAPWTVLNDDGGSGKTSSNAIFTSYTGFSTDGSATWHTGRTEWKRRRTGPALKARARKLAILSGTHSKVNQDRRGGEIIFDGGTRPEELELKCVIIGRKRISVGKGLELNASAIQTLDHYVLVVAHSGDLKPTEYIRVGVGSIPGSWIDLDGPGEKILVV